MVFLGLRGKDHGGPALRGLCPATGSLDSGELHALALRTYSPEQWKKFGAARTQRIMTPDLKARFDQETRSHPIVIYMKGNPLFPRCGFSAAAVQILQAHGPVHGIDVLADPDVRDGIKEYTRWPTIPQVFIHGKFVGGSDIIRELEERGELKALIDSTPAATSRP